MQQNTTFEDYLDEWLSSSVTPKLCQPSTNSATVALMTQSDFQESWELPLSVCVTVLADGVTTYKLLACEGREMETNVSLDRAINHIFHPSSSNNNSLCLYLWPGDQSQGFEGYPTDNPLHGPITKDRLELIFHKVGQFLADRQSRLVKDHVGLGITFLAEDESSKDGHASW